jgi:hypothetical protein
MYCVECGAWGVQNEMLTFAYEEVLDSNSIPLFWALGRSRIRETQRSVSFVRTEWVPDQSRRVRKYTPQFSHYDILAWWDSDVY